MQANNYAIWELERLKLLKREQKRKFGLAKKANENFLKSFGKHPDWKDNTVAEFEGRSSLTYEIIKEVSTIPDVLVNEFVTDFKKLVGVYNEAIDKHRQALKKNK